MTSNDTLARLAAVIEARRGGDPDKSYVARLFAKGTDAILKKIGEEATETVMAGQGRRPRQKIVYEVADLWFHSLVALAHFGLGRPTCWPSCAARRAVGDLEEFARRKAAPGERRVPDDMSADPNCIFCKIVAGPDPVEEGPTRTTSCWPSTTSTPGRRCMCWSSPSSTSRRCPTSGPSTRRCWAACWAWRRA
jgi:phosphoribosyl-ATP pyrophosphohydrolase